MYDAGFPSELHQRARGSVHVSFKRRGEATVLDNLRQDGCLKARFPRPERGAWAGAVLLNSSGGVAGGDRLDVRIDAGVGCAATVATQAAERIYRALPGSAPSTIHTRISVAEAGSLEWLPQETILFDRAALDRTLEVELAADACFTGVETLIFGRAEMGEQVRTADVSDRIRLRRAGKLMLHDAIRLRGEVAGRLASPCTAGGGHVVATLVHVSADSAGRLEAMREALEGVTAGASCWDGLLVVRIVARGMAEARSAVLTGLAVLRQGRPVPNVWLC